MPSATVSRPSFRASAIVDSTTCQRGELRSTPLMKLRSSLSSLNGDDMRRCSDENPVPKSSTESLKPRIRKRARFSSAAARLPFATLSVTSMIRRSIGRPRRVTACVRRSAIVGWSSQAGEALIAMRPGSTDCSSQRTACAALSSIASENGSMSADDSMDSMNAAGATQPSCGCDQRASASPPANCPSPKCTLGWMKASNCPADNAAPI